MKKILAVFLSLVGFAFADGQFAQVIHVSVPSGTSYTYSYTNNATATTVYPRFLSSVDVKLPDGHSVTNGTISITLKRPEDTAAVLFFSDSFGASTSSVYFWEDRRLFMRPDDILSVTLALSSATNADLNITLEK